MKMKRCVFTEALLSLLLVASLAALPLPAFSLPLSLKAYGGTFSNTTPVDGGSPDIIWVPTGEWYEPWKGYWTDPHSRSSAGAIGNKSKLPFSYELESEARTSLFPLGLYNESSIRRTVTYSTSLTLSGDAGQTASISLEALLEGRLWAGHIQALGWGSARASVSSEISIKQLSTGFEFNWTFADFVSVVSAEFFDEVEAEKQLYEQLISGLDGLVMEAGNSLTDIQLTSKLSAYAEAESAGHILYTGPALTSAHAGPNYAGDGTVPRLSVSLFPHGIEPEPDPDPDPDPEKVPLPSTVLLLGLGLIGILSIRERARC